MKEFKHELKLLVKDNVLEIEGVLTARVQYLHGENEYLFEPKESSKERYWISENRISESGEIIIRERQIKIEK